MYVFMRGRETELYVVTNQTMRQRTSDSMCQHEDPVEEAPCRVSLGIILIG